MDLVTFSVLVLFDVFEYVSGHGRLVDPPSRSSMWRYGFPTPHNYDDNQLFCGGVQVQYGQNGGKCGVCGDPWQGPLDNEAGGKYANGIIVRKYKSAEVINIHVELTASHKGYFEFRLCPTDNPFAKITHDCLNRHILQIDETGDTKYYAPAVGQHQIKIAVRLPNIKCSACVLQWKYNAGNSWGTNTEGKGGCIGCGNQEQFYGCADVAIGREDVEIGKAPKKFPWYFEEDGEWRWGIVNASKINNSHAATIAVVPMTIFVSILFSVLLGR